MSLMHNTWAVFSNSALENENKQDHNLGNNLCKYTLWLKWIQLLRWVTFSKTA